MTSPPPPRRPTDGSNAPRRADAVRNQRALLDAAATVFVRSGVDAPVREIATEAHVGMGTIYRHFPTRAELVIAVYRHQVEACAAAGPELVAKESSPLRALEQWAELFVDFLVTKHGLAHAMQSDDERFAALHAWFLDQLVPVCARLLDAATEAGEIRRKIPAVELLRAIGNLCLGSGPSDSDFSRRMVRLLLAGLSAPSEPADVQGRRRPTT